ncbi:unnamed protein product [Effrenium voratum]|nr:unnamed protein product [Effrenium voratum]
MAFTEDSGPDTADGNGTRWRRSLRDTFRALSDWDGFDRFDGEFRGAVSSARQAVEQHRTLISQASRIGGELGVAAVKLVEEAAGRGTASSPTAAYFCEHQSHPPGGPGGFGGPGGGGEAPEAEVAEAEVPTDLWEEVSSVQEELCRQQELRRGRSAAINAQDEALRALRSELMDLRLQVQEAFEGRESAAACLQAAEWRTQRSSLEALQDAHHEFLLRRADVARELRLARGERDKGEAPRDPSSWARDGPEIDALKAAKVELAELLAEADEVRLRSRRESAQLEHQLEGAQAEHARLRQADSPMEGEANLRGPWRRLARSDDNPFA